MKNKNMTALICAFIKIYHSKENNIKIYSDNYLDKILTNDEYKEINKILCKSINLKNNDSEKIKLIVNNILGPTVLGRSVFNKRSLENEIRIGCMEYVLYASGYDVSTLDYNINCYEIDYKDILKDKQKRLKNINNNVKYISSDLRDNKWIKTLLKNNYNPNNKSFHSLLGLSYYLTKSEFTNIIKNISSITAPGSSIIFDYQTLEYSNETDIASKLAQSYSETMKSKYSYEEIENILSSYGFKIYEHLNNAEMTNEFFNDYNTINPNNKMIAPKGVAYVLAVKK